MGFSRQEHWCGLPFLSPGDLPDPGVEPRSPTLQADSPAQPGSKFPPQSWHSVPFNRASGLLQLLSCQDTMTQGWALLLCFSRAFHLPSRMESGREWANRGSSGCRVSMCSISGGENERLYDALRKTGSQELGLLSKLSSSTTSCGCTDTEHFCGD